MPSTIEDIRSALLDAFDRQHQIDAAALLVVRHLTLGHPPELIISALARALLREDAGFHAYQMLEAGVRQFGEWGNTEPGRISSSLLLATSQRTLQQSAAGCKQPISQLGYQEATSFMRMSRRHAHDGDASTASVPRDPERSPFYRTGRFAPSS
jgi:hypothetical protein